MQGNLWKTIADLLRGIFKANQLCFIGKNVTLGAGTKISPMVLINDNVSIGEKTFIGFGCIIRPRTIIGDNCSFGHLTVIEGDLKIGDRVSFHAQCHVTKGTIVEDDVFFAPFYLGTNTKKMDHGRGLNPELEPPKIRKGARIGAGVILAPGIIIGKNSVIGAGSIVTKSIPDNEIWFGSPARKMGIVSEEEWL
jgi:acetyltransferase-like isoleucine patch superfamily enzyme